MAEQTKEWHVMLSRMETLEKQTRLMKHIGILVLILTMGIFLMGQAHSPARTVEAERFVLLDEHGKVRSELSMTEYGPRLRLIDEDEKTRFVIGMGPQMAGLGLFDANGQGRALLGVASDGTPGLCLYSQHMRMRIGLVAPPDRSASLGLFDENGVGRAKLTVGQDGSPSLLFQNSNGIVVYKAPEEQK